MLSMCPSRACFVMAHSMWDMQLELRWLGVSIWDCRIGVLSCVLFDRDWGRCWKFKISGLSIFSGKRAVIAWIGSIVKVLEMIAQLRCVCRFPI